MIERAVLDGRLDPGDAGRGPKLYLPTHPVLAEPGRAWLREQPQLDFAASTILAPVLDTVHWIWDPTWEPVLIQICADDVDRLWPEGESSCNVTASAQSLANTASTMAQAAPSDGEMAIHSAAAKPLTGKALASALDKWTLDNWGGDLMKLPDREELLNLARAQFGNGITQKHVRDMRRRHAPAEIKRGGGGLHKRTMQ